MQKLPTNPDSQLIVIAVEWVEISCLQTAAQNHQNLPDSVVLVLGRLIEKPRPCAVYPYRLTSDDDPLRSFVGF